MSASTASSPTLLPSINDAKEGIKLLDDECITGIVLQHYVEDDVVPVIVTDMSAIHGTMLQPVNDLERLSSPSSINSPVSPILSHRSFVLSPPSSNATPKLEPQSRPSSNTVTDQEPDSRPFSFIPDPPPASPQLPQSPLQHSTYRPRTLSDIMRDIPQPPPPEDPPSTLKRISTRASRRSTKSSAQASNHSKSPNDASSIKSSRSFGRMRSRLFSGKGS